MIDEEYDEINLSDFVYIIKKNIFILIIIVLLFAGLGFIKPTASANSTYSSSAQVMLRDYAKQIRYDKEDNEIVEYKYVDVSGSVLNTSIELFKSDRIIDSVMSKLKSKDLSKDELKEMVTVSQSVLSSQIIDINTTSSDKDTCTLLANLLIEEFDKNVKDLIKTNDISIEVINEPTEAIETVTAGGSKTKNIIIGTFIGCVIAGAYVVVCYLKDKTIKREEEVYNILRLPILTKTDNIYSKTAVEDICANINLRDNDSKIIGIISNSDHKVNKYIFKELSTEYSNLNKKTLMIDMDFRNKQNSNIKKGLKSLLFGENKLDDILIKENDNLYRLETTDAQNDSLLLMQSDAMKKTLSDLKKEFDYIIINTPELNKYSDGYVVASLCDTNVLSLTLNKDIKDDLIVLKRNISEIKLEIVGVVIDENNPKNRKK